MEVGGQCHSLAALPQERLLYPLYRRLGWPPRPVWTGAENLAPPGFDPQTIQPVVSHYTA